METKKPENNLDKTNNVMHDIASLHKKVDTSNDTVKTLSRQWKAQSQP